MTRLPLTAARTILLTPTRWSLLAAALCLLPGGAQAVAAMTDGIATNRTAPPLSQGGAR